jgi:8-oxo-dGTP diphosphatase
MDLRGDLRQAWPMNAEAFSGAKIALICQQQLVTYRRDLKSSIPFPGCWDLPGGGREGSETPAQCALREAQEEYGIAVAASRIHWCRSYPGVLTAQSTSYFLVAEITDTEVAAIRFGDEGQYWKMMSFAAFLAHPEATPHLQARFADYLAGHPPH